MYTKEDVAALLEDIKACKIEPAVEYGQPYLFGLAVDLYDPVSGSVINVCHPRHSNPPAAEVFRTPEEIVSEVTSARTGRTRLLAAHGFESAEQEAAARKQVREERKAQRELDRKQLEEQEKLSKARSEKIDADAKKRRDEAAKAHPEPKPPAPTPASAT